jgi:hypothetical protein
MIRRILRDQGLTLVLGFLFLASLVGHVTSGHATLVEQERLHGEAATTSLLQYLAHEHFLESLFENWESEFLQMSMYVLLTTFLFQRGSAESKDPDGKEECDEDPALHAHEPHAPWPVRRGGAWLAVYRNSLSLALALLFAVSFVLHARTGFDAFNDELREHGASPVGFGDYFASARFWFESFQNWQSEFLSVAALVVLSIFLRQHGSPESKPAHAPHSHTGKA